MRLSLSWAWLLGDSCTCSTIDFRQLPGNARPEPKPTLPPDLSLRWGERKVKKHHSRQRRSPRAEPGGILVFEDAQRRRSQKKSDEHWSVRQTEDSEQGTGKQCQPAVLNLPSKVLLGNDWIHPWNISNFYTQRAQGLTKAVPPSLEYQSRLRLSQRISKGTPMNCLAYLRNRSSDQADPTPWWFGAMTS